jgi:CRP/FNR family transcriptional regulator, cyclic AMP receptor protein
MPAAVVHSATEAHSAILTALTDSSAIGFIASALVLAAFGMKDMVNLRIVAICSNLAFITYALMLNLPPILILHVILLPLNGWRLAQELQSRRIVQRSSRTYVAVAPDQG